MADLPRYVIACLQTGKLAFLAILVSGGIVLQILACALYHNWWPMLTGVPKFIMMGSIIRVSMKINPFFAIAKIIVNMRLVSSSKKINWVDATKFLTGTSAVGSIAIPVILKHAGVICWGALAMELSSLFVFVLAIMCYIGMNGDDDTYRML